MDSNREVTHCARYSEALLPVARHQLSCVAQLPAGASVFDSFAGSGRGVDYLNEVCGFRAWGVELEPEWAIMSDSVLEGDALALPWPDDSFDATFVSPTYGNRLSDKDMRPTVAATYAKSLGRIASEGSSCHMQWGEDYRSFHVAAWLEATRVLKPGGYFLLNCKNHLRAGVEQLVSEWHVGAITGMGYTLVDTAFVITPGNRRGANHNARVDGENLFLFKLKGGK